MDITTYFSGSPAPAASRIAGNNDLLIEILSRVPARYLFRFKCVSQNWRGLISEDRRFALLHTKRNPSPSCSGLFSVSSSSSPTAKDKRFDFFWINNLLRFTPPPPAISFLESLSCSRILQSCNGLLLCASSRPDCAYFVCNPVLGRLSKLELPDEFGIDRNRQVLGLTLAFDASRWSGFKVICISNFAIDVYSSSSSSPQKWKRIIEVPFQEEFNVAFEGAYRNGKAIWLCKDEMMENNTDPSNYIVLDLEKETMKTHELPCDYSMVRYFGDSMGHLHLLAKDREAFNLYEMGADMEWALKTRVMESVMRTHLTRGYSAICSSVWDGSWIVSVVRKEDVYHVMWCLPSGAGRLVSYNCKNSLTSCLSESGVSGFRCPLEQNGAFIGGSRARQV